MGMEASQGPESVNISKEQVALSYKKFLDRGIKNPDDLDLDDPEVKEANDMFFKWVEQGDAKAAGDPIAEAEFNFEKTVFYIDAGFEDQNYLQDVLDQLDEDLHNIESQEDYENDPRMVEVKNKVEAKMKDIEPKL